MGSKRTHKYPFQRKSQDFGSQNDDNSSIKMTSSQVTIGGGGGSGNSSNNYNFTNANSSSSNNNIITSSGTYQNLVQSGGSLATKGLKAVNNSMSGSIKSAKLNNAYSPQNAIGSQNIFHASSGSNLIKSNFSTSTVASLASGNGNPLSGSSTLSSGQLIASTNSYSNATVSDNICLQTLRQILPEQDFQEIQAKARNRGRRKPTDLIFQSQKSSLLQQRVQSGS